MLQDKSQLSILVFHSEQNKLINYHKNVLKVFSLLFKNKKPVPKTLPNEWIWLKTQARQSH